MDPDVCLQKIPELIKALGKPSVPSQYELMGRELAEHVRALDEWISKGGFLPADWQTES